MTKVLGLDVGTNSLGWAITEYNELNDSYSLDDKGVCVFQEGVNRTKSGEEPLVKTRTEARGLRRHYFRRRLRKIELLLVLIKYDFCPKLTEEQLNLWRYKKIYPKNDEFMKWLRATDESNPYCDRFISLTESLDISKQCDRYVIGRAFYHLAQRRGFLSNRKDSSSNDDGVVKGAILQLDKDMALANCKYLGEFYYKLYSEGKKIRTGSGYGYAGRVNHYLKEFNAICDKQKIADDLRELLRRAIFFQRPLRSQKGLVGRCLYETKKSKCPISHPRFEEYRMWSFINNIKIKTSSDELLRNLNNEEINKILPLFFRKNSSNFDFEDIANKLCGKDNYCHISDNRSDITKFNFKMSQTVSGCPLTTSLISIFGDDWLSTLSSLYIKAVNKTQDQILNDVWHVLFSFDDDDRLANWAMENLQLDNDQAEKFSQIKPKQGYASLSLSMINRLLPYLHAGYRYDEAVYFVGVSKVVPKYLWQDENKRKLIIDNVGIILDDYNQNGVDNKPSRKKKAIQDMLLDNFNISLDVSNRIYEPNVSDIFKNGDCRENICLLGSPIVSTIKNPMVMRSMFRLRHLINTLLEDGKIDSSTTINIELARGLNDSNRRAAIERYQREQEKKRQDYIREIKELYYKETHKDIDPSENDVLKYSLWEEQNHKCIYTGREIDITEFIGAATVYDIEHTVPRSRGGDDSQMNKTLCYAQYNREVKKAKLPSELQDVHADIMVRIAELGWANDIDKLEKLISKKRMATKMANTKEAKDLAIRERHYLQIKLDYLKGKLSRFTMVEIPKGFSNRQGVDIGIISKYTRLYLNTIFRNVYVVKGETTSDFRKMWGLQDEYSKKERINHVHHCIDAITIACISKSTYDKWAKFKTNQENYHFGISSSPSVAKPWPTFTEDIKAIAEELLVFHHTKDNMPSQTRKKLKVRGRVKKNSRGEVIYQQGDTARASLHKQTFYGAIKREDKIKYVVRKSLDQLSASDIKNIVDDAVRECITKALEKDKNALSAPICFNAEKGVYIKKVRLYASGVTDPILLKKHRDISRHEHKQYYHVVNDGNYCMAMYEGVDNKGKIKRSCKVVNNLTAAKYFNGKIPTKELVPDVDANKLPLKYLIKTGTLVLFYSDSPNELKNISKHNLVKRMYKVIKMQNDGRITFKHHQEARNDEAIKVAYERDYGEKAPKLLTTGYSYVDFNNPFPKLCLSPSSMNMCVEGYDFNLTVTGEIKFKF